MSQARRITIRGEAFLTLESAAECFQVQSTWLREVYEAGLLGPGERIGGEPAIRVDLLDRLATIQRMHRHHGLDLATIELLLEALDG